MTIQEKIKYKVLKFLGLEKLSENPADIRFTFMDNDDAVWHSRIQEYRIWYSGDSDELQNWYTGAKASGTFMAEPIYNRDKRNYFWSIATKQSERVKKTHSGVPRAIVDTISNIVGEPHIFMTDGIELDILNDILKFNNFKYLISQEVRPMTLVEGWGAYKINFNSEYSKYPSIQYYNASDCDFIYKDNFLIGIIYKDYYKDDKGHNYVLFETRWRDKNNSYIKYELYRQNKKEITKVDMSELPELDGLKDLKIDNFPHILGVPSMYFYDQFHKGYGRSIYCGKLDVFDDMDQCLSQSSTTIRYSTPIEYINSEFLQRGPNGEEAFNDTYCRRYVMLEGEMDANGNGTTEAVKVTQPQLNVEQFTREFQELLKMATSGILTVSTMGVLDQERSNANAQREREKVTIMTRDNITTKEGENTEELCNLLLCMYEYMNKGKITKQNYRISVKYNEFANPSFESKLNFLGSAWNSGEISTDSYVSLLWKDILSPEEIQREKVELEKNKNNKMAFSSTNPYNDKEKQDKENEITDEKSDNPNNQ